jgi:aspartate carbamoyltransferase catalytic subunit
MPDYLVDYLGPQLSRTYDLDEAIREADVLSLCRNPDEFTGDDPWEQLRSRWLNDSYVKWLVDNKRLQQMKREGIVLHPRPINLNRELTRDVEYDPRMKDVDQMDVVVSGRLAVIARHMGSSIVEAVEGELNSLPELALV